MFPPHLSVSSSKWKVKYYKGLGTNTSEEAKAYFAALEKHRITFTWQKDDEDLISKEK